MKIRASAMAAISAHALLEYPREACGVLLGRGIQGEALIVRAEALVNRSQRPGRFWVASKDLFDAQRQARAEGLGILGYYHSHPDQEGRPSRLDRRLAARSWPDGLLWLILGVAGGTALAPAAWVYDSQAEDLARQPLTIVSEGGER